MKNLFTHEILSDDERYVPYENPYLVSRVSPETEAMTMNYDDEDDTPKLTDEEKEAIRSKEKKYLLAILGSFAFALISAIPVTRVDALMDTPLWLLPLLGIVVSFIFLFKHDIKSS